MLEFFLNKLKSYNPFSVTIFLSLLLIIAAAIFSIVWGIVHNAAQPGGEVSVLFIKYNKDSKLLERLEEEKNTLKNTIHELEAHNQDLIQELTELKNYVSQVESQKDDDTELNAEKEKLLLQIAKLQKQTEKNKHEIKLKDDEIEKLKIDLKQLNEKIIKANIHNEKLLKEITEKDKDIKNLKAEIRSLSYTVDLQDRYVTSGALNEKSGQHKDYKTGLKIRVDNLSSTECKVGIKIPNLPERIISINREKEYLSAFNSGGELYVLRIEYSSHRRNRHITYGIVEFDFSEALREGIRLYLY